MAERGYLDSRKMANTFNLMRSNDLIWPYIINNYFKGKTPPPFDLLYWNADATRMPAANHSFYLRNCYLKNKLARGEMVIAGKTLDLKKVKVPIYNLGTREDHIAPAKSVFYGSKYFGGPVRFVLAGSGHIAGVINPPDNRSTNTGPAPSPPAPTSTSGAPRRPSMRDHGGRTGSPGSKATTATWSPARVPGGGKLKPIEDAPGRYVKVRDNGRYSAATPGLAWVRSWTFLRWSIAARAPLVLVKVELLLVLVIANRPQRVIHIRLMSGVALDLALDRDNPSDGLEQFVVLPKRMPDEPRIERQHGFARHAVTPLGRML